MTTMTKRLALMGVAMLALSACETEVPVVRVNGRAHLAYGLAGATLEFHDAKGAVIASYPNATAASGHFSVDVPERAARRSRLVVRGGTLLGAPFSETLLVEVSGNDLTHALVYANPVTTMIARYLDRHPGATPSEAEAAVKTFLSIPRAVRPGVSLANPNQTWFDHELFLAEAAKASGGMEGYVGALLDELDGGATTSRFLKLPSFVSGSLKGLAKKLGKFLGKELANEVIGFVFDEIITQLGGGGTAEILEMLEEISHQLEEIKEELDRLVNASNETEAEIINVKLIDQVSYIQDKQDYMTWVAGYTTFACLTDAQGKPLDAQCVADHKKKLDGLRKDLDRTIAAILDPNTGMRQQLAALRTAMVPNLAEKGALYRWNKYLKGMKPFYSPKVYPEMSDFLEYYTALQAIGTTLLVEALVAEGSRDTAQYELDKSMAAVTAQEEYVNDELHFEHAYTVEDRRTKLVWMAVPWTNLPHVDIDQPTANDACKHSAEIAEFGMKHWRLPSDAELHEVVKGSPNSSGEAGEAAGIFKWLLDNGFENAPGDGSTYQRGFLVGSGSIYYASTISGISGYYYEALWDDGIDYACSWRAHCSDHVPDNFGAWCVTDELVEELKEAEQTE